MSSIPSLAMLRTFEAAARHESFSEAANELALTQSAVSRQVKELERVMGFGLFARVGRRVVLTEPARAYAAEVQDHLAALSTSTENAILASQDRSVLRIAVLPTFASRWLMPRLADLADPDDLPHFKIVTRLEPFDMQAERVDLAIHYGKPKWPDASLTRLCGDTLVPVATAVLLESFGNAERCLQKGPRLSLESRRDAWPQWYQSSNVPAANVPTLVEVDQFSMLIASCIAGMGVALLPTFLIERELADGRLVELHPHALISDNAYFAARPHGRSRPEVERFVRWLVHAARSSQSDRAQEYLRVSQSAEEGPQK